MGLLKRFYLLAFAVTLPAMLSGQDSILSRMELPIRVLNTDDGLSQNLTYCIAQDSSGYLWIATKDGLNRYDGSEFRVFRHDPDDSLSISDSHVKFVYTDRSNRLWISTSSGGLNLYDPFTESFRSYQKDTADPHSISSDHTGEIVELPDRTLIVRTFGGDGFDVLIEGESGKIEFRSLYDHFPSINYASKGWCCEARLLAGKDGTLWYRYADSLYRFSPAALRSDMPPEAYYLDYLEHLDVSFDDKQLLQDPEKENLYLFRNLRTLEVFDPAENDFVPILQVDTSWSNEEDKGFVDGQNRFWVWHGNGRASRYDLHTGTLTRLFAREGEEGLFSMHLSCNFIEDKDRNIWITTPGEGFRQISSWTDRFHIFSSRDAWFNEGRNTFRTTTPGHKALFDPRARELWLDFINSLTPSARSDIRAGESHLCRDESGNFYLTTGYEYFEEPPGLYLYDHQHKSIDTLGVFEHLKGISWFGSPLFFGANGNLWLGVRGPSPDYHLYKYDLDKRNLERYRIPSQSVDPDYRFICDWHIEPNGIIWLATVDGLHAFDPLDESWRTYRHENSVDSNLALDVVLTVHPDPLQPERYLWVGTEGAGLSRMDKRRGTFIHYTVEDGLPNGVINGILADSHDNLWLSTNYGLSLFDPRNGVTVNYEAGHGLPGNEFNRQECSISEEGIMYFGGLEGQVWFDPEDFYQLKAPPSPKINRLYVVNEPVTYGRQTGYDAEQILTAPMDKMNELFLEYDHRMFSLGFSLPDLSSPELNRFRYMLEGLDRDWIEIGPDQTATFTNLKPGQYKLRVKGSNGSGKWSSEAQLAILVRTPWWASWWFRSLIILLVAAILYALYRNRVRQLLRVEQLRNQIAQDLHDDIGSTLSSISLYGAVIKKTTDDLPEKQEKIIDKIIASTSEMIERMNDMVWTIKSDNDSFEQVVNRMRAYGVSMSEARDIELDFKADEGAKKLKLDMQQRKNIYLVYKEAVNNAAKYSGTARLEVGIGQQNGTLQLLVRDYGKGFDPDSEIGRKDLLGGNGLKSMKARAQEIGAELQIRSNRGMGTEVALTYRT